MVRNDKHRLANYLLDEIGLIEDRYVAEAATEYRRAGNGLRPRRIAVIGVSLTLTLSLLLGMFAANQFGSKSDDAAEDLRDEAGNAVVTQASGTSAPAGISFRLQELKISTASYATPAQSIDLFADEMQIIWKYADEEIYRVRLLTSSEEQRMLGLLNKEQGTALSFAESEKKNGLDGIWIALGDGTVISPCLEQTEGNVGYGTLFDYNPEVEPSDALTDLVCDILS